MIITPADKVSGQVPMNITKRPAIGERILRRALIAFIAFGWLIGQEKVVADDYLWIVGTGLWDNDNNGDPFGHPDVPRWRTTITGIPSVIQTELGTRPRSMPSVHLLSMSV